MSKPLKLSLSVILGLLRNIEDWEHVPNALYADYIQHKVYDIRFFAEQRGIAFRNGQSETIYNTGLFAWIPIIFYTRKFKKAFKNSVPPKSIFLREAPHG